MSDDTEKKSVPVATRPQGPVIIHATPPPPPKEIRAVASATGPTIVLPPRPKEVRPAGVQEVRPQARPLREEPRRQPPPQLTHMGRLGAEVLTRIQAAVASGNERELASAVAAGVALRLDHPLVIAETKRQQKANSAIFATRIKSARKSLARARLLISEADIEKALSALMVAINRAVKVDGKGRDQQALLHMIGTDEAEIDLLPYRFYESRTFYPDGAIDSRTHLRIHAATQSATALEPIRQIAPGEKIDAPTAKIVYRVGEQHGDTAFIQMPDNRHAFTGVVDGESVTMMGAGQYALMKRERMTAEDIKIVGTGKDAEATEYHLIGDDRWTYVPLSPKGFVSEPLIGSSSTGFSIEPSSTQIVMEKYVDEPLVAFVHEVGDQRYCYVAVLMKLGNVVVYEVPWDDEVLTGTEEDPILELVRGFVPADEPEPTTSPELATEAPIATV